MAKEIGKIEIVIRGTKAGGPVQAFLQYQCQDSEDANMRSRKTKEVAVADLDKKVHDAGTAGELWTDLIAAAETDEGIS